MFVYVVFVVLEDPLGMVKKDLLQWKELEQSVQGELAEAKSQLETWKHKKTMKENHLKAIKIRLGRLQNRYNTLSRLS